MEQLGLGEVESSGGRVSPFPNPLSAGKPGGKSSTNGVKSFWYLLQNYYITGAKNAHLVEKTTLLLRIELCISL